MRNSSGLTVAGVGGSVRNLEAAVLTSIDHCQYCAAEINFEPEPLTHDCICFCLFYIKWSFFMVLVNAPRILESLE